MMTGPDMEPHSLFRVPLAPTNSAGAGPTYSSLYHPPFFRNICAKGTWLWDMQFSCQTIQKQKVNKIKGLCPYGCHMGYIHM